MTLLLDTNVLISMPLEFFNSMEEKFFLSSITLGELENIKSRNSADEDIKYRSRQILHWLDTHEDKYEIITYRSSFEEIISDFDLPNTPDSKIIATAYLFYKNLNGEYPKDSRYFVTFDLACKTIAKSVGIPIYNISQEENEEYTGFKVIELDEDTSIAFYANVINENNNKYNLLINQYLLIEIDGKIVDKFKWTKEGYKQVGFIKAESRMFGKIVPKDGDPYQQIALDALNNSKITMLRGKAGTGKSYLAFGYMFQLLERGTIDKIIIFCNTVATKGSAKLGFYPGSRTEKLLDSQIGNLLESKLGDRIMVEDLINKGRIILLPLSDIRGYDTTGMNAAVYISEAQNLDIELMRLALQRIGEDSICILDGDSSTQVDLDLYAGEKNGMRRVSKVFRGADFYSEVTLQTIKRSKIAALAQEL